jgi:hypothetical protein
MSAPKDKERTMLPPPPAAPPGGKGPAPHASLTSLDKDFLGLPMASKPNRPRRDSFDEDVAARRKREV